MKKTPSNTREQCAYDSGAFKATMLTGDGHFETSDRYAAREARNPHKKGSAEYTFWNEGFDSV